MPRPTTLAWMTILMACSARPDREPPAPNEPVHVKPLDQARPTPRLHPIHRPAGGVIGEDLDCRRTDNAPACLLPAGKTGLWVHRTEIDRITFEQCVDDGACERGHALGLTGDPVPHMPVSGITFEGATALCAWLGLRLPTDDEWTRIAGADDDRPWPWGHRPACPVRSDAPPDSVIDPDVLDACRVPLTLLEAKESSATLDELADVLGTHTKADIIARCTTPGTDQQRAKGLLALGSTLPHSACVRPGPAKPDRLHPGHPWGLLGLAGNLSEWTSDPWTAPGATRSAGTHVHAVRGGSFRSDAFDDYRSSARKPVGATERVEDVGARCVWRAP